VPPNEHAYCSGCGRRAKLTLTKVESQLELESALETSARRSKECLMVHAVSL
jgi:hypothetical protein